jgi:hypothetical protein
VVHKCLDVNSFLKAQFNEEWRTGRGWAAMDDEMVKLLEEETRSGGKEATGKYHFFNLEKIRIHCRLMIAKVYLSRFRKRIQKMDQIIKVTYQGDEAWAYQLPRELNSAMQRRRTRF